MNNVINVWQDILILMQTTPMAALSAGAMAYLIPVLVGTSTGKNGTPCFRNRLGVGMSTAIILNLSLYNNNTQ